MAQKKKKHPGYVNIKILGIKGKLDEEELREEIEFWKLKNVLVSPHSAPISRAGNVGWMKKVKKKQIKGCKSIWRNDMVHILYNGDVILCCMDWRREVVLGNVSESSIKEIWNSEKRSRIEKMIRGKLPSAKNFICKRCEESIT